jgi:hypothetical protein
LAGDKMRTTIGNLGKSFSDVKLTFAKIREAGVVETALHLGLDVVGRAIGRCPACGADRRSGSDQRPPIVITHGGAGWWCVPCNVKGDALTLAALAITGDAHPGREGWWTVMQALGGGHDQHLHQQRRQLARQQAREIERKRREREAADLEAAESTWSKALLAMGTIIEVYLNSRSILLAPPPSIRLLDLLFPGPVMVARITDVNDDTIAIQQTDLPPDGIWRVGMKLQRRFLGRVGGGAVRLGDGESIVIAEGIESALSASQLFGLPAYAALSAVGIEKLVLPPHVQYALIFADADDHGESVEAATAAYERWTQEGRSVDVFAVPDKDANDTIRGRANAC